MSLIDFDFDLSKAEAKEALSHLKTAAEIESLTFPESLNDLERAKRMLSGDFVIQQDYALERLPALVASFGATCLPDLVSLAKSLFPRLDIEGKILLANSIKEIATKGLAAPGLCEALLMPIVLNVFSSPEDDIYEISAAYSTCLEGLLSILPRSILVQRVIPLTMSMARVESEPLRRELSCTLLASILPLLTKAEIQENFSSRLVEMCQDPERAVRAAACRCLGKMDTMGRDVVENLVLHQVLDAMEDEDTDVREAALETLLVTAASLPEATRIDRILPFLRRAWQRMQLDPLDPLALVLAKRWGELLESVMGKLLTNDDVELLAKCFHTLACFPYKDDLRLSCAHHAYILVKVVSSARYVALVHETLLALTNDREVSVRAKMAAQMPLILPLLGAPLATSHGSVLYEALLRDQDASVRELALAGLVPSCEAMLPTSDAAGARASSSLLNVLSEVDRIAGSHWRTRHALLTATPTLLPRFPPETAFDLLVPLALRSLQPTSPSILHAPAADVLVACLRLPKLKPQQRTEVYVKAIREFCKSKSCSLRITFLHIAHAVLKRFSSRFVRECLFDLILELVADVVPNVRLAALRLLPLMKQSVRLPVDVEFLDKLTQALRTAISDQDVDVSSVAREVQEQFKSIPIRMARGNEKASTNDDPNSISGRDKVREDEEANLLMVKEDIDRAIKAAPEGNRGSSVSGANVANLHITRRNSSDLTQPSNTSSSSTIPANNNNNNNKATAALNNRPRPSLTKPLVLTDMGETPASSSMGISGINGASVGKRLEGVVVPVKRLVATSALASVATSIAIKAAPQRPGAASPVPAKTMTQRVAVAVSAASSRPSPSSSSFTSSNQSTPTATSTSSSSSSLLRKTPATTAPALAAAAKSIASRSNPPAPSPALGQILGKKR